FFCLTGPSRRLQSTPNFQLDRRFISPFTEPGGARRTSPQPTNCPMVANRRHPDLGPSVAHSSGEGSDHGADLPTGIESSFTAQPLELVATRLALPRQTLGAGAAVLRRCGRPWGPAVLSSYSAAAALRAARTARVADRDAPDVRVASGRIGRSGPRPVS